jgi:hypothetical protein
MLVLKGQLGKSKFPSALDTEICKYGSIKTLLTQSNLN